MRNILDRIKKDRLRPPHQKGIVNFVKRKLNPRKTIPDRNLSIFLTTLCNLDCFSCAALGMNPRPKVEHTSLEDIDKFLDQMKSTYPGSYVMLTGGEPTAYPWFEDACKIVRKHGFKTAMLTNGFKIVNPELLDFIILDFHGDTNGEQIDKWKMMLDDFGIEYGMHHKQYHRDIGIAIDGNITKGSRCANWLNPFTLWKDVVYMCCNLMCVEWWNDDNSVTVALRREGWTTDNPDLSETIENWRETLPPEVYKMCTLQCWKDSRNAEWSHL